MWYVVREGLEILHSFGIIHSATDKSLVEGKGTLCDCHFSTNFYGCDLEYDKSQCHKIYGDTSTFMGDGPGCPNSVEAYRLDWVIPAATVDESNLIVGVPRLFSIQEQGQCHKEYGDTSTVMGYGSGCPASVEAYRMDWVIPAATIDDSDLIAGVPRPFNIQAMSETIKGIVRLLPTWMGNSYIFNLYFSLRYRSHGDLLLNSYYLRGVNVHSINRFVDARPSLEDGDIHLWTVVSENNKVVYSANGLNLVIAAGDANEAGFSGLSTALQVDLMSELCYMGGARLTSDAPGVSCFIAIGTREGGLASDDHLIQHWIAFYSVAQANECRMIQITIQAVDGLAYAHAPAARKKTHHFQVVDGLAYAYAPAARQKSKGWLPQYDVHTVNNYWNSAGAQPVVTSFQGIGYGLATFAYTSTQQFQSAAFLPKAVGNADLLPGVFGLTSAMQLNNGQAYAHISKAGYAGGASNDDLYTYTLYALNNGQAYVHTSEAGYAGGARTEDLYTYTQNAVNNMWTMKQTVPTAASFGAPGYGIASLSYGLTASISSTGFMPIIAAMGKQLFGLGALDSATQLDFTDTECYLGGKSVSISPPGAACKWFHATAASGLTTSDTTAYWIAAHLQTGANRYIMLLVQVDLVKGTPVAYAREAGWTDYWQSGYGVAMYTYQHTRSG
eukprot:gene17603-23936_t